MRGKNSNFLCQNQMKENEKILKILLTLFYGYGNFNLVMWE